MRFDRGAGRLLKLLVAAVVAEEVFSGLPLLARFPLVFLSVLLGDLLRLKARSESPLYLEELIGGVLLYAGAGLLCGWIDAQMSLYTTRHAGPIVPALLFALIDKAWPAGRYTNKRR